MDQEKANEGLFQAAESGNVAEARAALNAGAKADGTGFQRRTVLELAADRGDIEMVTLLLDAGADVNYSPGGESPLFRASLGGHTEVCKQLLDAGAQINAPSNFQSLPIHAAAGQGHCDTIALLIEHGADLNAKDRLDRDAIAWASTRGHGPAYKLLEEAVRKQHGHAGRVSGERKDKGPPQVGG